jgi:hypothetical protein
MTKSKLEEWANKQIPVVEYQGVPFQMNGGNSYDRGAIDGFKHAIEVLVLDAARDKWEGKKEKAAFLLAIFLLKQYAGDK